MFVNKVKQCFDEPTRHLIIESLVLSILNYCSTIWGTTNTTLITKVRKLQNLAAKVVEGKAQNQDHVTPITKELKWLGVSQLITFDTAVKIYKHVHGQYPEYLLALPTVSSISSSTSRQQGNLYVQSRYGKLTLSSEFFGHPC